MTRRRLCEIVRVRAVALMAMSAMTMEEVHQRAGEQQQVWGDPKCMLPVLPQHEERDDDRERGGEHCPSAIPDHIRAFLT